MERLVLDRSMDDLSLIVVGRMAEYIGTDPSLKFFGLLPGFVTYKKHHDWLLPTFLSLSYSPHPFVVFVLAG